MLVTNAHNTAPTVSWQGRGMGVFKIPFCLLVFNEISAKNIVPTKQRKIKLLLFLRKERQFLKGEGILAQTDEVN